MTPESKSAIWILRDTCGEERAARRGKPRRPLAERFWEKVDKTGDDCWPWMYARDKGGYGRFVLSQQHRSVLAHRIAYELGVGPIPDGTEIDHLCRNRACCNPIHLEAVSHQINILRGDYKAGSRGRGKQQEAKTHCPKGHAYAGDNLILQKRGGRVCKICLKKAQWRYYHENGGREKVKAAYLRRKDAK